MLTFATQTFANGNWTLTPEEPATLQLVLMGLGTLAIYAVFSGWRLRRTSTVAGGKLSGETQHMTDEYSARRAA